jgi:hypothetical protein
VQNDFLEERTAEEHDQPVAVKRNGFAGSGHVIKIGHPVTEPAPNRLETIKQNQRDFADLEFADIGETFGKTRVNVVTINAVAIARPGSVSGFAAIAAEAVQHELNHVALAMVRRRHMGEYKQLHTNAIST